jgi:HAD superfamily hydrolase (TIGR01509 family)
MERSEKTIIFDVEGTLIDCVPQTIDCWLDTLTRFSLHTDREALARQSGADGELLLRTLFPDLSQKRVKEILSTHAALYNETYLRTCHAFPGVDSLFSALQARGFILAIATTCSEPELAAYDREIDAVRHCEAVVSGSEVKRGKPYPDLLTAVLRKLQETGRGAIAVGDTPYDAEGAKSCGLPTIGVLSGGYTASQLLAAGCTTVIGSAVDLLSILQTAA